MTDENTYTPTGELQNLLADQHQQNTNIPTGVQLPKPPTGAAPTTLDNGAPVVPFDDTPPAVKSFKRSQIVKLTNEGRYQENREDILKAHSLGLIEEDMIPANMRRDPNREPSEAEKAVFKRSYLPILVRNANTEANKLFAVYQTAKSELEQAQVPDFDDHERAARGARAYDAEQAWKAANEKLKELQAEVAQK
jgi:hypothetical protein